MSKPLPPGLRIRTVVPNVAPGVDVDIINIGQLVPLVAPDYFDYKNPNRTTYRQLKEKVAAWAAEYEADLYSADREDFSNTAAAIAAYRKGLRRVVVEDLSLLKYQGEQGGANEESVPNLPEVGRPRVAVDFGGKLVHPGQRVHDLGLGLHGLHQRGGQQAGVLDLLVTGGVQKPLFLYAGQVEYVYFGQDVRGFLQPLGRGAGGGDAVLDGRK